MARQGKGEQGNKSQGPEVVIVTTETPLFTTTISRHRYRITPKYVQEWTKAARYSIRDHEVEQLPYECKVYHAVVDVYELLPGYTHRKDIGAIVRVEG